MNLSQRLRAKTMERYQLPPEECGDAQLFHALMAVTQDLSTARPAPDGARKLYYFSAEFLMGKLLSNNLLALGLFE